MKLSDSDKRSSLLRYRINDGHKMFLDCKHINDHHDQYGSVSLESSITVLGMAFTLTETSLFIMFIVQAALKIVT